MGVVMYSGLKTLTPPLYIITSLYSLMYCTPETNIKYTQVCLNINASNVRYECA